MEAGPLKKNIKKVAGKLHRAMDGMEEMEQVRKKLDEIEQLITQMHSILSGKEVKPAKKRKK